MSRSLKQILSVTALLASATMISTLCACGGQDQAKQTETAAAPQQTKSVIVYFSQTGTTKKLAGALKQAVNADEIELKLVNAYPSTYDSTIAMVEVRHCLSGLPHHVRKFRPADLHVPRFKRPFRKSRRAVLHLRKRRPQG